MIGRLRGRPCTPLLAVCMPSAGSASTIRMPADATAETAGRASTRSRIAPQTRDSPWLR
jgi:hypothetical protein